MVFFYLGSLDQVGYVDLVLLVDLLLFDVSVSYLLVDMLVFVVVVGSDWQLLIDLIVVVFFDVDNILVQGLLVVYFGCGLVVCYYFIYCDVFGFFYVQVKFQLFGKENSNDVVVGWCKVFVFIEG